VVPWKEVEQGYSHVSLAAVRRVTRHARLLFSFRGRTYGMLALYRLPAPRVSLASPRGLKG
jgi:hypothetical protein